ncbi:MAG: hypothetical protein ACR2RF_12040 [Geminicoccaceae bacterium]
MGYQPLLTGLIATLAAAVVMLAHPALADELEPLAIHEDEFYLWDGAPTQLNLFG